MNKKYILGMFVSLVVIATAQSAFAKTANLTTISPISGTSIEAEITQTIRWTSSDYPANAGVNINLLRQVSNNPSKFEFVKTIKKDTTNDGEEVWTPSASDTGNNIVIQVSCSSSYVFPEGCSSGGGIVRLSVVDKAKRQSYTASIVSSMNETLKKMAAFLNSLRKK